MRVLLNSRFERAASADGSSTGMTNRRLALINFGLACSIPFIYFNHTRWYDVSAFRLPVRLGFSMVPFTLGIVGTLLVIRDRRDSQRWLIELIQVQIADLATECRRSRALGVGGRAGRLLGTGRRSVDPSTQTANVAVNDLGVAIETVRPGAS